MRKIDVLIVGAGPTGLVLAMWLTRLGVRLRIVDKTAEPQTTSRAVAVQARTLELYDQIDLAGAVVERGRKAGAANLWVAGKNVARLLFGDMGTGLSPFPYALIFPQDEHEHLLIDRLAKLGVEVERRTELQDFEEAGGPDGSCTDADGFLWNAEWGASRVVRYAPTGEIDRVVAMPVTRPSCPAFGGPRLRTLFVTSARYLMSPEEDRTDVDAGSLYAIELDDVQGTAANLFAL